VKNTLKGFVWFKYLDERGSKFIPSNIRGFGDIRKKNTLGVGLDFRAHFNDN